MEMPVDPVSLLIIAAVILFPVCLIAVEEARKLIEFKRLDADSERREREAKKYFERGDGK